MEDSNAEIFNAMKKGVLYIINEFIQAIALKKLGSEGKDEQ